MLMLCTLCTLCTLLVLQGVCTTLSMHVVFCVVHTNHVVVVLLQDGACFARQVIAQPTFNMMQFLAIVGVLLVC